MKILKIESLEKGWSDRDFIMLHACFQLLKDCVEKEKLFEHSPHYAKSKKGKVAKELYDWWKVRTDVNFKEDKLQDEFDEKQLMRLMKIRRTLWT